MTVGDARQNYSQTYTVSKGDAGRASTTRQRPPHAAPECRRADDAALQRRDGQRHFRRDDVRRPRRIHRQTVYGLASGEAVFAGPREDGFYRRHSRDLRPARSANPGQRRQLRRRPRSGRRRRGRIQGLQRPGFAIQIPIASLPSFTYTAPFANLAAPLPALGRARRRRVCVGEPAAHHAAPHRRRAGSVAGRWIQVNRMGNPLFNEVLVALKDKDNYNRTLPTVDDGVRDVRPQFRTGVLINFVFGTSFATTGRVDLAAVFIPDVLRVDTTTAPSAWPGSRDSAGSGSPAATRHRARVKSSGWPNGRRFGDDVVDIALTAVASGPTLRDGHRRRRQRRGERSDLQSGRSRTRRRRTPGTRNKKDSGINK